MDYVKEQVSIIKEELPDGQTTLCGSGKVLDANVFSEFVSKKQIPIIKEELPDGQTTLCGSGNVLDANVFSEFVSKKQIPIIKEELPDGQTTLCGGGDVLDANVFSEFVSKKQIPIIKEELPDKWTMSGGVDVEVFSKNTHLEANAARSEKESSYSSAQALCEICGKTFTSAEAARVHVTVHTGHISGLLNPAEKSGRAVKQSEAVDKQSQAAKKRSREADEQSGRAEKQSRGARKKRDKPDLQSGESEIASQSHVPGGTTDTESSDDDEESTPTHLPKSPPPSSASAVNPAKSHISVLLNPAEESGRAVKQSEAVDKQSQSAKKRSGEADEQSGRAEKQSRGARKKRDKPDEQSGESKINSQSHVPGGTTDTSSDDDEESTSTHLPKSTPPSSVSAVNPAKKPIKEAAMNILRLEQKGVLSNTYDCIRFLREHRILAKEMDCPKCASPMCEEKTVASKQDGYSWRCRRSCCRTTTTIRKGSFFEKSNIGLCDLLLIIYLWAQDAAQQQIAYESSVSERTIVDWANFLREICSSDLLKNKKQLGGPGHIIAIGETQVAQRKCCTNAQGPSVKPQWLFGGIDLSTKEVFIELIPEQGRTAPIMEELITRHIARGSTISSDKFASYNNIEELGKSYIHQTVKNNPHQPNFRLMGSYKEKIQKHERCGSRLYPVLFGRMALAKTISERETVFGNFEGNSRESQVRCK